MRRRGEIAAADREAAFQALKAQGVKPAKLEEAPGVVNILFGKGKRWIAITVLLAVAGALAVLFTRTSEELKEIRSQETAMPRHQIYGEPAFMENLERTDYASVFALEGERYLACFAQPGQIHRFTDRDWRGKFAASIPAVLTNAIAFAESDRREVKELKQVVNGMKDEIGRYLANGVGTPDTYVKRLEERQTKEFQIYNLAVQELKDEKDLKRFEVRNAALRAAGLKTLPLPDED